MKTVVNKTPTALKVPLPRGKSLRLAPGKSGQIRDGAEDHPALKKLIEAGKVEVFEGGDNQTPGGGEFSGPHQTSQGQGRSSARQKQGDR